MDFNYMRQRSLFDPYDQNTATSNMRFNPSMASSPTPDWSNQDNPDNEDEYSKLLKGLGTGAAQQKYKDFIGTQPDRQNYEPGKGRKIAALLAGVGTSLATHNPIAGYKFGEDIADQPYNDAMYDFKMKSDKLKTAADLEEKDRNNNIKTFRDILEDKSKAANLKRQTALTDAQIADYQSKMKNRGRTTNFFTNEKTGHRMADIFNPADNSVQTVDAGEAGETADQKSKRKIADQVGAFEGEVPGRIKVATAGAAARGEQARITQAAKFKSITDLVNEKDKLKRNQYTYTVDDKTGMLVGVNKSDPTDVQWTDVSRITPEEKAKIENDYKVKLKQTPGSATQTKTTTKLEGNTKSVETTRTPVAGKVETVHIKTSDNREFDIPKDKLEEAKKRDPNLKVVE